MVRLREAKKPEIISEVSEQDIANLSTKLTQLLTAKADKGAVERIKAVADKLSADLKVLLSQLKAIDHVLHGLEESDGKSDEQIKAIRTKVEELASQERIADKLVATLNTLKERISQIESAEFTNQITNLFNDISTVKETIEKLQESVKVLSARPRVVRRGGGSGIDPSIFNDHSARHEDGGDDEISLAGLSGTPAALTTHEAAADPHTQYQKESEKGQASGYASLNASTKVTEDPANATATPTASKIPIADAGGKLDGWVSPSSTTVPGLAEAAIASEVTTGTDAARAVTPDALAGSEYGKRMVEVALNAGTALAVTDKAYFRIPSVMNGWNLIEVAAMCKVASTSGAITITVKNGATSMLSTNITIDQDEYDTLTAATPAVIDTANDGVATGAQIEVAVSGAGVGVTYLVVELTFQLP